MRFVIALLVITLCSTAALAQSTFTYQGELNDNGNPVNATKTLRFVLFDDDASPTAVESLGEHSVDIVDGLFTIELTPTTSMSNDLYLEVTVVEGTDHVLSPRQRITFAPKSLYSLTTRGIHVDSVGRVGINTTSPEAPLEVLGGFGQTEILRLGSPEAPWSMQLFTNPDNVAIQSFMFQPPRPGILHLNPAGGLIDVGPDGFRFPDGSGINSVPTNNLIGLVGTATATVSEVQIEGGGNRGYGASVPGAMPGDFVIVSTTSALSHQFIIHNARVSSAGFVGVTITNANTDDDAIIFDTLDANTINFLVLRH